MTLAIVGSRSIIDKDYIFQILDEFAASHCIDKVVSGGAIGVDTIAEQWAISKGLRFVKFIPNWALHGKAAGVIRNESIINECDECIAFWDGLSKGTLNSIELCNKSNKSITLHNFFKTSKEFKEALF